MEYLITRLREHIEAQEKNREAYEKTSYWASENNTCARQVFWRWNKEKATNPPSITGLQIMRTGKKVEDQIVEDWDKMGILVAPPEGEDQHRIDIERFGINISGKLDAIIKEKTDDGKDIETPVEIKSYYGDYQEHRLFDLQPNESYAKQLAIYMDALNKDRGILYMVNRGSGRQFQFVVIRKPSKYEIQGITYVPEDPNNPEDESERLEFKVGFLEFTIEDAYRHFAEIDEYVKKNKLPPTPFSYKYPLTLERLKLQKNHNISKARTGKKVLGDWQCLYCNYKDKCLKEQGIELGYTKEEKAKLMELTKGYSSKKWRE